MTGRSEPGGQSRAGTRPSRKSQLLHYPRARSGHEQQHPQTELRCACAFRQEIVSTRYCIHHKEENSSLANLMERTIEAGYRATRVHNVIHICFQIKSGSVSNRVRRFVSVPVDRYENRLDLARKRNMNIHVQLRKREDYVFMQAELVPSA